MKIGGKVYPRPPWDIENGRFFSFHWLGLYFYSGDDSWLQRLLNDKSGIDVEFWKWRFYIAW